MSDRPFPSETQRTEALIGGTARPSFLLVGAQRAGTTALWRMLVRHPKVVRAVRKEIHFFDQDRRYGLGVGEYLAWFPLRRDLPDGGVTFEATPGYLYFPRAANRIALFDDSIPVVVLLRDPVARALSHHGLISRIWSGEHEPDFSLYDEAVAEGLRRTGSNGRIRSFDDLVEDEISRMPDVVSEPEPSFVRRGEYARQVQRLMEELGRERVHIEFNETLVAHPRATLGRILDAVGLTREPRLVARQKSAPIAPDDMSDRARAMLREFYEPHDRRLAELLGKPLPWAHG